MPFGLPRPLRPGDAPRVADLNAAMEALAQMAESSSAFGSDLSPERGGGGLQVNDHSTPGHWGKITGSAGGLHAHVEMTPDGLALAAGQGYYGTAAAGGTPAREVNGLTAATGTVVWMTLDSYRRGWVFSLSAGGGFYASVSGSGSPYSFAEVAGPAVGSAAVTGGRAGTYNATEVLTGLAGIPTGTVVWMTEGTVAQPYRFACLKIVYVASWTIDSSVSPCTIVPLAVTSYYVSAAGLCGRAV